MNLELTINGSADSIALSATGSECAFQLGAGPERHASVEIPAPGAYSILLGGRSYDARIERMSDGLLVVAIDGFRFEIEVRDPRRWTRRSGGRGGEGVQTVVAPMPGKVVRVLIAPGDEVKAGQGLLVVEAMKMQNELKASRAGRVLTVPGKEGATVAAGEVLATIE